MEQVRTLNPKTHVEPLDNRTLETFKQIANTVRGLSMDAVQKADSGHPGLPLGCAELGAYLFGKYLNYNPKDPKWMGRDRFILSAGHGSMWLYSLLFLSGYDVSLEDIKNFRQLHSKTPGHPESFITPGVEVTTGPLGQGFGNAVGMALGLKYLAQKFDTDDHPLLNVKVVTLAGDGCIMEGVSSETSSLAGHLKLNNLIAIYDSNKVCLDGPTQECLSEDTRARYKAYGWDVIDIDGHNFEEIHNALAPLKLRQERPTLIIAHTVIGRGSPNKQGTSQAHGSPLGPDEIKLTKEALGIPETPFFVPQTVRDFFDAKLKKDIELEKGWQKSFDAWSKANPDRAFLFKEMQEQKLPSDIEAKLKTLEIKSPIAGRKASQDTLNFLADVLPYLIGGSADLSVSDLTLMKKYPLITPGNFQGRNIKFGVREFGMATMAIGINFTQMLVPFIGTFLTFSDYMRNAIRLAAMSHAHVIYQFTHDSIFLGEDGPTHQPVEHYMTLRAIPGLNVIRPGDANEVKMSWIAALDYKGPTALLLSRQNIPLVPGTDVSYKDGVGRGAYILRKEKGKCDFLLLATGSELALANDVANELEKRGKNVRLVSMPCWEIFEKQDDKYKKDVLGGNLGKRVSIEAGISMGWSKYVGPEGVSIAVDTYGASAPYKELAKAYGFTVEDILERIL